jgi:uncharacterized protein (DUF362 family)
MLDRRRFLTRTAGLLGAAASPGLLGAAEALAAPPPDVVMVKGAPGAAARAAVGLLGGMAAFVKKGARVVLKPNMSFAQPPEAGATTHPEVLMAVAAMCWEAGAADVLILDHTLSWWQSSLERSGIQAAGEAMRPGMVRHLNDAGLYAKAVVPGGVFLKETEVPRPVLAADVLIAVPTAKSHSSGGVSLALKGMMGLVYNRGVMHRSLDEAIVDLASLLRPTLTVVDAMYVLSTGGPSGPGTVLAESTVLAATDMVAADAATVAAFEWYGRRFRPAQVPHIRRAHERGLGRMDVENLRVETLAL